MMVITAPGVQKKLRNYKFENELLTRVRVSEEERIELEQLVAANKPLPDGFFKEPPAYAMDKDIFFKVDRPGLEEELDTIELLLFRQSENIKTLVHLVVLLFTLPVVLFVAFGILNAIGVF